MEKEVDPEVIKATQNSLGKYVKRPPLTDKLLKKPPFRFLHDVVTTILKNTGFFEGLFNPEELISDNVKDRDSKISFLNKVISVVGIATGETLSVKSSKIVAGQEPEKTNELLQTIARALDQKISSDDAVRKYKESSNVSSQQVPEKEPKKSKTLQKSNVNTNKLTSTSNEKLTNKKKEHREPSVTRNEKNNSNKIKQKEISKTNKKKESLTNKSSSQSHVTRKISGDPSIKNESATDKTLDQNNIIQNKNINDVDGNSIVDIKETTNDDNISETSNETKDTLDTNSQQGQLQLDQNFQDNAIDNSLSSQDLMEVDNTKFEEEQKNQNQSNDNHPDKITNEEIVEEKKLTPHHTPKKTIESENKIETIIDERPIKNGNDNYQTEQKETEKYIILEDDHKKFNLRPPSVRPSSSRPGAPRLRDKHDTVLNANDNLIIGKVNIIVENTPNEEDEDNSIIIIDQQDVSKNSQGELTLSSNRHGHLVQQILDSQKELSQTSGKTEIEWQFGAQKAREAVNQEVEQLRFNIQTVSRVANPLGKLLDHIQEDVEVMRQELQQWTKAYEEASKKLVKQKQAMENSLIPLHSKLSQLNIDIEEKHEKINDLKVIIHKNSSRIEKLLASGNMQ